MVINIISSLKKNPRKQKTKIVLQSSHYETTKLHMELLYYLQVVDN